MKRLFCTLIALILALGVCVAEETDWYLETAKELAACAGQLAGDDSYIESMSSSEEIAALLRPFAAAESAPASHAWKLSMHSAASQKGLINMTLGADSSDAARERYLASLPAMAMNTKIGMQGCAAIAASTLATFSRTFIMPEDFEACAYVLQYGDALFFVSFTATGEDTITAAAQPLPGNYEAGFALEPSDRLFFQSADPLF